MREANFEELRAAIAALEGQRATLGDEAVEAATAALRARLAALQRPAGVQHRHVTVLFADVVGSTALAQGLDAEDTRAVLGGALQRMAAIVQAHGGRVLRFTGDGVKAAFGMDEAREDDAERAVRAGLAIVAAGREQPAQRDPGIGNFAVRVGVHSGDVALGAGVEADNTAMGAAVNIAARMEQSAPAGALRISHDTWSLVRGLFALEPQPPLQLKGVEAPMQTYLVRAALDRSTASVERGLQGLATPLVGRQAELGRLLDTVAAARETRQLQALTVIGDAGLGKSRLLREMTAELSADPAAHPAGPGLITLRSQPDGMLRPFGLVRALLATQCGVADTDSAEVARAKVVAALSPRFDERAERHSQLIGQLSGLDFGASPHLRGLDPRALRDQAFAALRAYLRSLAAPGPGVPVLVVEDLHWADDGSLELLQHLLAHAAELPLALVMTARPALLERRADWGPPQNRLPLSPLAAHSSAELAQALLRRIDAPPARLTELVVGRAEGNPYYMEELVRRLIDDGVIQTGEPHWTVDTTRLDSVRLPGTLVGLLQARLDALPGAQRQAARQASIVGHVFWDDALQALDPGAPQALPALQRAAFVRAHDTSDFVGTAEWQFDHHLLHQVTYDTLLKAERKLGHGAAARWLLVRTQGRGAEFLAMTGEHAERAGETALAIDCFEQAGREAQKRFANAAAAQWLRRAVALLGDADPGRRFDLLKSLVTIADIIGNRSEQSALHAEMTALLEHHPDGAREAELWVSQALLADRRGDSASSERLSWRAFARAEQCGAARWAAMARSNIAWLHVVRKDTAGARAHIEAGLEWAGRIEAEHQRADTEAQLLTVSAIVSAELDRLDEARATLHAVLARGEALGVPRMQLGALSNLANVAIQLGRWDEAAAWGERMCTLAQAIGSRRDVAMGQLRLAQSAEGRGDLPAAIRWHEQSHRIHQDIGDRRMQATNLRFLGGLHLQRGDLQAAAECCARSQALHQALDLPLEASEVAACAALCELRQGRTDLALATLEPVLDRLESDLADVPAAESIEVRWACVRVLTALDDRRGGPLLGQLHADVQARAAALGDVSDRERLIRCVPVFRDVVSAYRRLGDGPRAAG